MYLPRIYYFELIKSIGCLNISDECYQCTHYKERIKPIQICDENDDSDSWEKYKMRCLLGDIEV